MRATSVIGRDMECRLQVSDRVVEVQLEEYGTVTFGRSYWKLNTYSLNNAVAIRKFKGMFMA